MRAKATTGVEEKEAARDSPRAVAERRFDVYPSA